MTTQITNTSRWFDGQRLHQVGTIALSGTYLTGQQEILSFADGEVKSSRIPDFVEIHGEVEGFQFNYSPGTDISDGALVVFLAGVELSGALYPGNLLAETVHYHAIFKMR
jgi:hypothetical protein